MHYLIKTEIRAAGARRHAFTAQKTMYGGRRVAAGDQIYLFASETHGGDGLIARGVVVSSAATPRRRGVARQTPRVDVTIRCTARAKRALGRDDLKSFRDWQDGRPQTELNFKFYRQATDKIGGITPACAKFLDRFF